MPLPYNARRRWRQEPSPAARLRESAGRGEPRRWSRLATENRWPVWLQLTWFFVYLRSEDHNLSPTVDPRSVARCEASSRSTPLPRPLGFELGALVRLFLRENLTAGVVSGEPPADKSATGLRDNRTDPRPWACSHINSFCIERADNPD